MADLAARSPGRWRCRRGCRWRSSSGGRRSGTCRCRGRGRRRRPGRPRPSGGSSPPRIWTMLLERLQRLERAARVRSRFLRPSATRAAGSRRWGRRRRPCGAGRRSRSSPACAGRSAAQQAGAGRSDANAGSATHAPSPRRKWRRLRLAAGILCEFRQHESTSSGSRGSFLPGTTVRTRSISRCYLSGAVRVRSSRGRCPPLLERGRFDDAREQGATACPSSLRAVDDLVHRLHVVVLEAAAEGVGQHLLGQAAVEVEAALGRPGSASAPGRR